MKSWGEISFRDFADAIGTIIFYIAKIMVKSTIASGRFMWNLMFRYFKKQQKEFNKI